MSEHEYDPGQALGAFLRARRERLTPEEAGLVVYGRRRTPGLRREEVAQLAHIGTSWYASLEQGRDVHPSEEVLDSLAKALLLSEDERLHLHLLAKPQSAEITERPSTAALEQTVAALDPNPAFLLGRSWDFLYWNRAAELVFRLPSNTVDGAGRPNWLKRFFTDTSLRADNADWLRKAEVIAAQFRAQAARFPRDPRFQELVEELTQASDAFREIWPRHDVRIIVDCHKQWYDPRIGDMAFELVALQPPDHSGIRLMIYTAAPETAARLQAYLSGSQP